MKHRAQKSRIYLTGFMGSGKSTIGPMLARQIGWNFQDLDDHIVSKIGTPIATFFSREGEPAFRTLESITLEETASLENSVIALGGGAICTPANLAWTLENGMLVYLEVSAEYLFGRLRKEQNTRPMLLDEHGAPLDKDAVTERISALLSERIPFYSQAHLIINTDNKPIPTIVREIRSKLPY